MVGNKIAYKITKISRGHHRIENIGFDWQTPKERYIYLQKEDDNLLISWDYYNNIIIESQKITNLLDNTSNQPSKFMTKNWVEVNDD